MNIHPTQIIERVADYYHVPARKMRGPDRARVFAWPRQVAMYLIQQNDVERGLSEIGYYFSQRHHTTVIHALQAVQTRMTRNVRVAEDVRQLSDSMTSAPELPALVDV